MLPWAVGAAALGLAATRSVAVSAAPLPPLGGWAPNRPAAAVGLALTAALVLLLGVVGDARILQVQVQGPYALNHIDVRCQCSSSPA
jgi:hypothetical protein